MKDPIPSGQIGTIANIADCYPEANFNGSVSQEIYYQHTYFT